MEAATANGTPPGHVRVLACQSVEGWVGGKMAVEQLANVMQVWSPDVAVISGYSLRGLAAAVARAGYATVRSEFIDTTCLSSLTAARPGWTIVQELDDAGGMPCFWRPQSVGKAGIRVACLPFGGSLASNKPGCEMIAQYVQHVRAAGDIGRRPLTGVLSSIAYGTLGSVWLPYEKRVRTLAKTTGLRWVAPNEVRGNRPHFRLGRRACGLLVQGVEPSLIHGRVLTEEFIGRAAVYDIPGAWAAIPPEA